MFNQLDPHVYDNLAKQVNVKELMSWQSPACSGAARSACSQDPKLSVCEAATSAPDTYWRQSTPNFLANSCARASGPAPAPEAADARRVAFLPPVLLRAAAFSSFSIRALFCSNSRFTDDSANARSDMGT